MHVTQCLAHARSASVSGIALKSVWYKRFVTSQPESGMFWPFFVGVLLQLRATDVGYPSQTRDFKLEKEQTTASIRPPSSGPPPTSPTDCNTPTVNAP